MKTGKRETMTKRKTRARVQKKVQYFGERHREPTVTNGERAHKGGRTLREWQSVATTSNYSQPPIRGACWRPAWDPRVVRNAVRLLCQMS